MVDYKQDTELNAYAHVYEDGKQFSDIDVQLAIVRKILIDYPDATVKIIVNSSNIEIIDANGSEFSITVYDSVVVFPEHDIEYTRNLNEVLEAVDTMLN